MELDEIEAIEVEALARGIDDALDIGLADDGQDGEVRHELRVDADARQGLCPALIAIGETKAADQFLDAGVDIRAVEGGDPGIGEGDHVRDGLVAIHRPVPAGQLPATADDAGDVVAGRDCDALHDVLPIRHRGEPLWSRHG